MAVTASTPIELVEGVYARFEERIDAAQKRIMALSDRLRRRAEAR